EIGAPAPGDNKVTVKVNVDEVRIDAVVVDWRGRYVTDLTAEDFEIYQDGKPLEITSCRYIRYDQGPINSGDDVSSENSDLPPASTPIPKREEVRRTLVFLVDNLNMDFDNAYYTRMSLRKYVEEQMKPGDLVAILTTSKGYLGPLAFTSDKELLMKSIQNVRKDFLSLGDVPGNCEAPYEHMLAAIRYFNKALQNMPGRRSMVFISAKTRLPIVPDTVMTKEASADKECEVRIERKFNELADELLQTGVVFHTMDIRGLVADPDGTDLTGGEGVALPLSEKTGGLFLENDNFFVDGIGQLEQELNGFYLLTYLPPNGAFVAEDPEGVHKIEIKTKRPMSEVRHRTQIVASETMPKNEEQSEDSLMEAVVSPFQNHDLSIQLSSGYIRNSAGESLLRSWVYLDGTNLEVKQEAGEERHLSVEVLGMISDLNSRIWDEGRQSYHIPVREDALEWIRKNGLRFSVDIPAKKPGAYYVRVAVKDEGSGKQGSAYQYVEVPDLKKDQLALSDIFISRGQGGETRIEGIRSALKAYMPGDTIGFGAVIYNARVRKGQVPELQYGYVIYKDGIEKIQNGPITINSEDRNDREDISFARNLRLPDSIEPGTYNLKLVVQDKRMKEQSGIVTRWMDFEIAEPEILN
ncbi:MAG: VWA domain-containing protein, partial [Acidobacteriota bacterium]